MNKYRYRGSRDKRNLGFRGFKSQEAYEDYYSDINNYRDELASMERYARECEEERKRELSDVSRNFSETSKNTKRDS